jgi:radical SAM superfamily enzyme YgiQ (UPF0313 family)
MLDSDPTATEVAAQGHRTVATRAPLFRVVLVNPYELGRQPFALASPTAWLARAGFAVECVDLSLQKLDPSTFEDAGLVAIYVGMHTATRIAIEALPRIRQLAAPRAHLCVYGLYAPMNEATLRERGVATVLGGEFEPELLALAERLRAGDHAPLRQGPGAVLPKVAFIPPDRSRLPALARYARLLLPDGTQRVAGFAEGSRGCKHLCRHCPVVPVYRGRFRVVPVDVVMADIHAQVAAGARHISFGDPDFLNGPTHALRLARALHGAFPQVTFDATIKVQHLIEHAALLPELARLGCLFITSAVESVDDRVLEHLDKHHTGSDFERVTILLREAGIAFAPTFVAFTPWTTLHGYLALLGSLVRLGLVENVPPVQLTIRLLIPEGSYLLDLPGFRAQLDRFDPAMLGYPWRHDDPRVDGLQRSLMDFVAGAEQSGRARRDTFAGLWERAHAAAGAAAPSLDDADFGAPAPRLSEPWYCCAEPTAQQLQSF